MLPRGAEGALGTQSRSSFPGEAEAADTCLPTESTGRSQHAKCGLLEHMSTLVTGVPRCERSWDISDPWGMQPRHPRAGPRQGICVRLPCVPTFWGHLLGAMGSCLGPALGGTQGPPSKGASLLGLPSQRTTESVALNSGRDCLLALEATGLVRLWLWGRAPPRLCPSSRAIPGTPWLVALSSSLHEVCPAVSLQGRPSLL